jgi:hypothetical protein
MGGQPWPELELHGPVMRSSHEGGERGKEEGERGAARGRHGEVGRHGEGCYGGAVGGTMGLRPLFLLYVRRKEEGEQKKRKEKKKRRKKKKKRKKILNLEISKKNKR